MSNVPHNPYQPSDGSPILQAEILDDQADATGGVIPYKNPQALVAYYLAVFSLIPCVGILLGIPAIVLGVLGLRARNRNPIIKGSAHAWIGIILGGLTTLTWLGLLIAAFVFRLQTRM